jgi:hypothetical protein
MPNALRALTLATLSVSLFLAIGVSAARAQGSAGGSIGNDDKSISGSRSGPRSVEPAEQPERPARRSRSETAPQQPSSRRSGSDGGGGNFDGTWAYVGIGTNCQGTGRGSFRISGGRVVAPGGSGSVAPNGAYHSSAVGEDGVGLTAVGRLSGNSGGGTYMRADGCGGRWSATRQ